jgi:hypothetical protein
VFNKAGCASARKVDVKLAFKPLGFDRGQDVIRFKSGAYTPVREHFESNHNAAHGQKMMV